MTNPRLQAALDYAQRGWRVVQLHAVRIKDGVATCSCANPKCSSQGKHPRARDWVAEATTDAARIKELWAAKPESNVGITLGDASGVVAIDIDPPHGDEILLQVSGGDLPPTVEMVTGKGRRLIYAIPEGLEQSPRTRVVKDQDGHEGIRLQSTGGQCVMPPSLHPNGRHYLFVDGHSDKDTLPAPMPQWMIVEMCRPDRANFYEPGAAGAFTVGEDFNRRGSWDELLKKHGAKTAGQSRDGVRRYTRPGKEGGCSATVGHYKAKDGTPALFVFSGNWAPFEGQKCYDLFGAYARLEHAGDFAKAARELERLGYGTPRKGGAKSQTGKANQAGQTQPPPEDWPDPIPLRNAEAAPPFPLEVFPVYLQDYALSVADLIGVPVGYVGANMLGVAAGAIGATVRVELTPEWRERACLWVAIVADKSAGKSPTHAAVLKPLQQLQAERVHAGEKQVYYTTNATVEAIGPQLKERPRGLLLAADELSGLVTGLNQYKAGGKGSDRQFWLDSWSGASTSVLRRNPDAPHTFVANPCVSIVGGLQPAVLSTVLGVDDGFAERFLYEASDPLPMKRASRERYQNAREWKEVLVRLAQLEMGRGDFGPMPAIVPLTEPAWDAFASWTEECAQADRQLTGYASKARGYAARLALVLHMIRSASQTTESGPLPPLESTTMLDGIELMRYYLAHVARVRQAANSRGIEEAETVLAWVKRDGKPVFTRGDVYQALRKRFTSEQLREPLKLLVQHRWLRYADHEQNPKGGRPAEARYLAHPLCKQACEGQNGTANPTESCQKPGFSSNSGP